MLILWLWSNPRSLKLQFLILADRNSTSLRGISEQIDEKRAILEEKLVKGKSFTIYTYKPDNPLVVEIPRDGPVVGESMFEEVWKWVEDKTVRCIGLYGMGGVGKTTLLDKVHNHFLKISHDYDFVLPIVVSRPLNLDKIQEAILKKLEVERNEWESLDRKGRGAMIHRYIMERNFLLFLDDLWDPINLVEDVGVPCRDHPKKCKIMFTTRDRRVCERMQPEKSMKVDCLSHDEALLLFRQKLGEKAWNAHPEIPKIATTLVRECGYLPLAVVAVARSMAGTTELKDWRDAERDLKSRASNFQGMDEEVLAKLEFSYDRLPNETHKICFLYLSIFPEDREIDKDDVIDLWVGEGFLDECGDVWEARACGDKILTRLRQACLVEFVQLPLLPDEMVKLKMHDVVREMASWVYSDHGLKRNRVLVQGKLETSRLEEIKKWKDAERISLWGATKSLVDSGSHISCSHLSTLIISETILSSISDNFFSSMPSLRVLDLSYNYSLTYLPSSIWNLVNLRYLRLILYDDIRTICIPKKIKNLKMLQVPRVFGFVQLPMKAILKLSSLRVFQVDISSDESRENKKQLEVLEKMQSLEEVSVTLQSVEDVKKLLGCTRVPTYLRELNLSRCHGLDSFRISTSTVRMLRRLQSLQLISCSMKQIDVIGERQDSYMEPIAPKPATLASPNSFNSLKIIGIFECGELTDVTSLIYHAPTLVTLEIMRCKSLKEVIVGDIEESVEEDNILFPCLMYLELGCLEGLERICRRSLRFPSLKRIRVYGCPQLKELSLNRDSAHNTLQAIEGLEEWWERLVWDDPTTKQNFSSKFVSYRFPWEF